MVNLVWADTETDGINPTKIHFVAVMTEEMDKPMPIPPEALPRWVEINKPKKWVFHNGLAADVKWINRLIQPRLINPRDVIDTMVVSRLVNYGKFNTHSLKELGEHLGIYKGDFSGPWDVMTPEMLEYGLQDVEVLKGVFDFYAKQIYDPAWAKAMRLEHDTAIICSDMSDNGFYFEKPEAEAILSEVSTEMTTLEEQLQDAFPPVLAETNRIKYRIKKNGELYSNVQDAIDNYPLTQRDADDLVCFEFKPFNPGSPKDRIDKLWDSGWKPTEMTKGHKKFIRDNKGGKGKW